jgi:hypothetical protein
MFATIPHFQTKRPNDRASPAALHVHGGAVWCMRC